MPATPTHTARPRTLTPLRLPEHVVAAMPEPVGAAWSTYCTAAATWKQSTNAAQQLRMAAKAAPQRDQEAALAAVKAGKPVPAATGDKAADKAERAGREAEAHLVLALGAERDYIRAAHAHRSEWLAMAHGTAIAATAAAQDAVNAAEAATTEAVQAHAVWQWLRFAKQLDRAPSKGQLVASDYADVRKRLAQNDPAVTEREHEQAEAEARERAEQWKVRGGV